MMVVFHLGFLPPQAVLAHLDGADGFLRSLAIITFFFSGYGVKNVNAEKCLWNFPNVVISQVYETGTVEEVT